ncbi:hypothetical protein GOC14_06915 [Sinorhizobium meliloti]|nr:hypothetical protein [Sinorhizobium meliloti]
MRLRLIKSDRAPKLPEGLDPRELYLGHIISSLYDLRNRVHRHERIIVVLLILVVLLGIGDVMRLVQWVMDK